MFTVTENYGVDFMDHEWGPASLTEGQEQDRMYGAGSWVAYMKYCEEGARGWTSWCPEHGDQQVVGSGSTGGVDPYHCERLACGHWVLGMGPGNDNVYILDGRPRFVDEW